MHVDVMSLQPATCAVRGAVTDASGSAGVGLNSGQGEATGDIQCLFVSRQIVAAAVKAAIGAVVRAAVGTAVGAADVAAVRAVVGASSIAAVKAALSGQDYLTVSTQEKSVPKGSSTMVCCQ